MAQPRVDRDRCMGSGNCAYWAPATFDIDDEGKAVVLDPHGDPAEAIANAVEGCPTSALSLVEDTDAGDPG